MKSPRSLITAFFLFFLFAFNTAAQTNKMIIATEPSQIVQQK
jgi:hypothetical protein